MAIFARHSDKEFDALLKRIDSIEGDIKIAALEKSILTENFNVLVKQYDAVKTERDELFRSIQEIDESLKKSTSTIRQFSKSFWDTSADNLVLKDNEDRLKILDEIGKTLEKLNIREQMAQNSLKTERDVNFLSTQNLNATLVKLQGQNAELLAKLSNEEADRERLIQESIARMKISSSTSHKVNDVEERQKERMNLVAEQAISSAPSESSFLKPIITQQSYRNAKLLKQLQLIQSKYFAKLKRVDLLLRRSPYQLQYESFQRERLRVDSRQNYYRFTLSNCWTGMATHIESLTFLYGSFDSIPYLQLTANVQLDALFGKLLKSSESDDYNLSPLHPNHAFFESMKTSLKSMRSSQLVLVLSLLDWLENFNRSFIDKQGQAGLTQLREFLRTNRSTIIFDSVQVIERSLQSKVLNLKMALQNCLIYDYFYSSLILQIGLSVQEKSKPIIEQIVFPAEVLEGVNDGSIVTRKSLVKESVNIRLKNNQPIFETQNAQLLSRPEKLLVFEFVQAVKSVLKIHE